jgi:hypothetical protein
MKSTAADGSAFRRIAIGSALAIQDEYSVAVSYLSGCGEALERAL